MTPRFSSDHSNNLNENAWIEKICTFALWYSVTKITIEKMIESFICTSFLSKRRIFEFFFHSYLVEWMWKIFWCWSLLRKQWKFISNFIVWWLFKSSNQYLPVNLEGSAHSSILSASNQRNSITGAIS